MTSNRRISLLSLAAIMAAPGGAWAEAVDYGSLQALFGEPVTTSATGTPQRASDVPANMTIVTADEIRQSGSRNIPEILSRVPGLDILKQSFSTFDVGVQGYQQIFQPRLLVLLDGRQVFIDDYSRTIWDNVPVNIDDIRQIEIVQGASSALFGSNAGGGVINIITYSPLYDKHNVVNATVGTQHSLSEDATVMTHGEWGGTKFTAGGLNANEFSTPRIVGSDEIPTVSPQHQYAVSSTVFQINPKLQASTEATYSNSTANSIDGLNYVTTAQKTTTWSARAGFDWQSPYGLITNNNYYNHTFVDAFETPQGDGIPYGLTVGLFVSQLQDTFKIGSNDTFRAALEYRHKDFTNTGIQLVPQTPKLDEDNYSVSGTWVRQFNDKLSWTNAVRVEREQMDQIGTLAPGVNSTYADYSHEESTWSANSDFVYKVTDLDTLRFGYGRGVQLPSLIESGFNENFMFDGFPVDAEGSPHLKPTIDQDLRLDYDRKVPSLSSTVKVSTFYEYVRDAAAFGFNGNIQMVGGNPFFIATAQNFGDSHGWGGELQIKGKQDGFRWDASYSLARAVDEPALIPTLGYQGNIPEHHFRLLLGYSIGPWEFDANGQYVTSTRILRSTDGGFSSPPSSTSGYESVSGRIGYNINDRLTLSLSGNNLSRPVTQVSPYPAVERQVFLGLTGKF